MNIGETCLGNMGRQMRRLRCLRPKRHRPTRGNGSLSGEKQAAADPINIIRPEATWEEDGKKLKQQNPHKNIVKNKKNENKIVKRTDGDDAYLSNR